MKVHPKLTNAISRRLLPDWPDTELAAECSERHRDGYAVATGYLMRRMGRMPGWWVVALAVLVFALPAKDM